MFDSLVRQTIDKEGSVFNISSYLNDAARTTSYGAERREKLHNAEDQRRECVRNILKDFSGDTSTTRGKIDMILHLQDMKKKVNYVNTAEDLEYEAQAFNLWVYLLGHSMFSNVINKAQMEMLVQDRFMDDSEMTKLLKKEGYKWDYEYYSEDAFTNLSGDTKIRIDDVLQIVEPRFREVLYID